MNFKIFLEQEWKRNMGMPNQLDNPVMDKALNNDQDEDEAANADPYSIDNIHAIENHLRSFSSLIVRITKTKKFFGMEDELEDAFKKFRNNVKELINLANQKKIQQPQVNQDVQGIPLNQQLSTDTTEKLKGEQPPRMQERL